MDLPHVNQEITFECKDTKQGDDVYSTNRYHAVLSDN